MGRRAGTFYPGSDPPGLFFGDDDMSGTLRYTLRVQDTFNSRRRTPVDGGSDVTITADERSAGVVQPITTAEGSIISKGSITTEGWLYMRNDDDTNYVEWGPDSAGSLIEVGRMMPGEEVWFRQQPGVVVRARSHTTVCDVTVEMYSD